MKNVQIAKPMKNQTCVALLLEQKDELKIEISISQVVQNLLQHDKDAFPCEIVSLSK